MRYMTIVKGNENQARTNPPPQAAIEAVEKWMTEAATSGRLVSFGGLHPTETGARVRIQGGKITTVDGPFTESKEVIGGFSILEYASREEAVAEAVKFMEMHRELWPGWEGETEIRLMFAEGEGPS